MCFVLGFVLSCFYPLWKWWECLLENGRGVFFFLWNKKNISWCWCKTCKLRGVGDKSKGYDRVEATQEGHCKFILSPLETEKEMLQSKGNIKKAETEIQVSILSYANVPNLVCAWSWLLFGRVCFILWELNNPVACHINWYSYPCCMFEQW